MKKCYSCFTGIIDEKSCTVETSVKFPNGITRESKILVCHECQKNTINQFDELDELKKRSEEEKQVLPTEIRL